MSDPGYLEDLSSLLGVLPGEERHNGTSYQHFTQLLDRMLVTNWSGGSGEGVIGRDIFIEVHSRSKLIGLAVAYLTIIIVSVIGNSLVCFIIYKNKRLHTVTYILAVNLAVSDLMLTVFNIPFTLSKLILDDWIFGTIMCKSVNCILMASIYSSTLTMAAIAWDKYTAIIHPLRARATLLGGLMTALTTWFVGLIMSLPFIIYSRAESVDIGLRMSMRCRVEYPQPAHVIEGVTTIITFSAQLMLPISITGYAYVRIIIRIWAKKMIGSSVDRQKILLQRSRRRTVKMLVIVVLVFLLCWLPINLYHILTDFLSLQQRSSVYLACHWLAMSSVCYNPLIYCWLHRYFRAELRERLPCGVCQALETDRQAGSLKQTTNQHLRTNSSTV